MLIIGIAGGSGSGKTTVVNRIAEQLPQGSLALISQDAYYRDQSFLTPEEKKEINFDHPSSIEFPLLIDHLGKLRRGEAIEMPVYSYISCSRSDATIAVEPRSILIVEGILIFTHEELRSLFDIKVFVDAEPDDRLIRIMTRDMQERGRDVNDVLRHYQKFVKPMHLQFIEPSKRYADIIIPQGGQNHIAVDIVASRIRQGLEDVSFSQAEPR
ncbi:MAG: uridine kinase [Bacteroidetes bacterium]|nr:uridine kinase [Bacteroidota bacterium]